MAIAACAAAPPPFWPPPPPASAIDTIEQQLKASPCVGDLSNWQRRYAYRKWIDGTAYHLDSAVIEFWLREVGKFEFKPGREFVEGPLVADPDDGDYKVVFGSYDFLRRKFTLEYCGPNRR